MVAALLRQGGLAEFWAAAQRAGIELQLVRVLALHFPSLFAFRVADCTVAGKVKGNIAISS